MQELLAKAETTLQILFAAHALALLIVNLTPTKKDDEMVAWYYRVIEILAGLVTRLSKQ